jgi:hypothetical protein
MWRRLPPTARMASTTTITTPVRAALAPADGDRCAVCAAQLAPDQRYCLTCGERCREPRVPRPEPASVAPPPAARRRRRPRPSTGLTLIAGVATLLLAMGVGVLVGRSGDDTGLRTPPAAAVQVVTVPGAGAATPPTPTGDTTPTGSPQTATSTKGTTATSARAASAVKRRAAKARAAKRTAPPVKLGSKGSGRGYKDGKFTGDFFGG